MPLLTRFNPSHLHDPRPNGNSVAAIVPGGARTALVSGLGAHDERNELPDTFTEQVKAAYASLATVLEALDATPQSVARLTTYVVDHDVTKLPALTEAVLTMFGDTPPAQTLVPVPALAVPGMMFEVEATVVLDD